MSHVARPSAWSLYLGLALVTCSMLLVQQFLTRVFTIQFNSGLAFLAISITFLGLGAAGVAVYVLPRWFRAEAMPARIPVLALLHALALVVGLLVEVVLDRALLPVGGGDEALRSQVVRVLQASVLMLPAMVLAGLVISLVLRQHGERVGRLYGADLAGGGVGCLLLLPLMEQVGGDHGIFAIGALAAAGAALLAHAHGRRRATAAGGGLCLLLALLPFANRDRALCDIASHGTTMGGVRDWVDDARELGRSWNALSRLSFFPTRDGMSVYVRIDSSCQTTIPSQDPQQLDRYLGTTDFERLPFALPRHRRCLELGAGGGRGMVLAAAMGAESVTGVEINPGIVAASLHGFPGFGIAPLLQDGRHRYLVDEGRSYARACSDTFDSVTITFIQTGIANSSAAFALSEANLFTTEAFVDLIGKLDRDGVFFVYRHPGNECLRLIGMLRDALRTFGVTDLRPHLYIASNQRGHCLVLAGRSPLQPAEVAALDASAKRLGLRVLYAPGDDRPRLPPNPFPALVRELREQGRFGMDEVTRLWRQHGLRSDCEALEAAYVRCSDPAAFQADWPVDIRPATDDRPYFFFTGLNRLGDFLHYFEPGGVGMLGGTVVLLSWMAVAFLALVAVLIILPLLLRRPAAGPRPGFAVVAYFAGLGLGYIAVQISFIQRFTLFLGHPAYALSVVLLALLLASGCGSFASGRLLGEGRRGLLLPVALLVALLLLYDRLLPWLSASAALGWPVLLRIGLTVVLVFPLGFTLGLFFPHGIRLVQRSAPELVPWAWGANSAASVMGSIVALFLAIHFGFSAVALAAALAYALLTLPAGIALFRAGRA